MVIVGTKYLDVGGTKYDISKVIVHEDFDYEAIINDVALIILSSPIEMTFMVKPITLSEAETGGDVFVNLTGWGAVSYPGSAPTDLQSVNLKTTTVQDCKVGHSRARPVLKTNICTLNKRGEGACLGDEGGPLVDIATGAQVGILSWFEICALGVPDVYTRVSSYISWINENKVD